MIKEKMTRYYYDPIIGLRYTFDTFSPVIIQPTSIPERFDSNRWIKLVREIGVMFIDSKKKKYTPPVEHIPRIIYNYTVALL